MKYKILYSSIDVDTECEEFYGRTIDNGRCSTVVGLELRGPLILFGYHQQRPPFPFTVPYLTVVTCEKLQIW